MGGWGVVEAVMKFKVKRLLYSVELFGVGGKGSMCVLDVGIACRDGCVDGGGVCCYLQIDALWAELSEQSWFYS